MLRIQELTPGKGQMADIVISRETWRRMLKDPKINSWLDDMGCEDGMRKKLFDKIDFDGNGMLEINELVTGLVDLLRGRFDNLAALTMTIRAMNTRLIDMEGALKLQHDRLQNTRFAEE